MELSSLSEEKWIMFLQEMNNFDEINYFFMNNYQNKIGIFVKRISSLFEIEALKRVQKLRIDEFSRRRLIENQDTVNELTARIQELHNEVNCMNDSRDLQSLLKWRFGEHCETDLAQKIESFDRDISKYKQQSSDLISDAIKHGIVCGGMAHQGLKQHVDRSISPLTTFKALRDEIIH